MLELLTTTRMREFGLYDKTYVAISMIKVSNVDSTYIDVDSLMKSTNKGEESLIDAFKI